MKCLTEKWAKMLIVLTLMAASGVVLGQTPEMGNPMVNINDASEIELAYLPGVGPSTAAHIVEYRQRQAFKKPMHLMRVKGIGRKTFARLKPYIIVTGPTTATRKIRP